MAEYRFGNISPPDDLSYRFGDIDYVSLAARSVEATAGLPGQEIRVNLGGTFDQSGKTVSLAGVSITPTAQDLGWIEFIVPDPLANGSAHAMLRLGTSYSLEVDDTGDPVSAPFTILIPETSGPTYWYIESIIGGVDVGGVMTWNESSFFHDAANLSNGDSAFFEVTVGGPMLVINPDGSWVAENPLTVRGKAYNVSDGWSAAWSEYVITTPSAIITGFSPPPPWLINQAGAQLLGTGFGA